MVTTLLLFFKGVNNNDIDSFQRPNPAPLHWPNSALESATLDESSPALKPFTNTPEGTPTKTLFLFPPCPWQYMVKWGIPKNFAKCNSDALTLCQ